MRTDINIDDKRMDEGLRVAEPKTKREAERMELQTLLRLHRQEKIRRFRGKLDWQGNLNTMRQDG
ncbi:MAG: type II toxin-antitoxin system VapB family antitoxin [Zoogloeaceae bacterium]|jgi:Arc/MetJ family transcription regulator|nr:type II toxin-antitoxin system VapB family antitoxin [Zoogloeaceae bacterium]